MQLLPLGFSKRACSNEAESALAATCPMKCICEASSSSVVLSTIEGADPTQRLLLCLVACELSGQAVELQRQSWSDSVGWFTQSRVRIAKDEVNFLRSALGAVSTEKASRKVSDDSADFNAIIRFPSQHSA